MASYQEQVIGIVGQDPGIPISLAVYRFLRMHGSAERGSAITDSSRRFAYAVIFGAVKDGALTRIKEGPSVRLYPSRQETRS